MAFVTQALEEELAVPHEAAIFIMYAVHYGALGQVQVLSREDAETAKARIESRARAKGFPLRVDVFVTADEPGGWEHSVPA
jgi:ATP-dependent Clp protease adapter protein ClpS